MSNTEIYLKNIPISYLKEQPETFFSSTTFTKAVELFDKIKYGTDDPEDTQNQDILPLYMVKNILISKYLGNLEEDLKFSSRAEEVDFLVAVMLGKPPITIKTTPRKFITKAVDDINDKTYFNASINVQNPLIKKAMNNLESLSMNSIGNIDNILPPKKTNNVLLDVTKKVKWYESLYDDNMYDDVKYSRNLVKRLSNSYKQSSGLILDVVANDKLFPEYEYNAKDLHNYIKHVKTAIKDKYFNFSGELGNSRDTVLPDFDTLNRNLIDLVFKKKSSSERLQVYMHTQIDSSTTWEIQHDKNLSSNYKLMIFDTNGKLCIDHTDIVTENDNIRVTFPVAKTGTALVLFDNFNKEDINKLNLLTYMKFVKKGLIIKTPPDIGNLDNTYYFTMSGISDYYLYLELYTPDGHRISNNIISELSVKDDVIKLVINDSNANIGYILSTPTYKFYSGNNIMKVSSSNLFNIMKNYDLFTNELRIW